VRAIDRLEVIVNHSPVKLEGQTLELQVGLKLTLPLPDHDRFLPDTIEASVHQAGLILQRLMFQLLMERADQDLVFHRRHGKDAQGIQRRGTRPYPFKTLFGDVTIDRIRISHNADGSTEIPSATAWNTPEQITLTQNLRDAVCDLMRDQSAGDSQIDVGERAGGPDLLGRSTILEILYQEGELLVAAQRTRASELLEEAPESEREAVLVPVRTDPCDDELSDVPPDESEEAQAEWEQAEAAWAAAGFPGCEPVCPVKAKTPRQVDEGFVIVQPDEVQTKAQPCTGRKAICTFTAVVLVAGWQYSVASATTADLWLQVAALLWELGVTRGQRRLLVLGDGARWIRDWFEGLRLDHKVMISCWYHVKKRCYGQFSLAGGPKDRRRAAERAVLEQLWIGEVDAAIALLRGAMEWVRTPQTLEDLIAYLEKRRGTIPNYQQRQRGGLWIASTRVEKFNDWSVSERCKGRGMSWTPVGVLSLAALEAARENGELNPWRQTRELPKIRLPEPGQMVA
jgi:hypothetical protein